MNKEEKYNFDRFYVEGVGIFLDVLEDKKIGTIHACKLLNEQDQQLAQLKVRLEEVEGQYAYECECNKQFIECQKENEELKAENEKLKEYNKSKLVELFDEENKNLQQQLKVKDEEIEKLKKDIKEIIDFDYKHNSGIVYATRRSIEEIANLKKYIEDLQNDNKKLANILFNKIKRNVIEVTKASDETILKEYLDKFVKGA